MGRGPKPQGFPHGEPPDKERSRICRKADDYIRANPSFASQPFSVTTAAPAALVLDTNVLLDWLVFRDPSAAALEPALAGGAWRWHATAAMRSELERVLTYQALAGWSPEPAGVWSAWERWAVCVEPAAPPLASPLRCTDPDDQKFLDLALQLGRCTLLSRDRAVLKLARRATPLGVAILSPERWHG